MITHNTEHATATRSNPKQAPSEFTLNGKPTPFSPGQSILEAAINNGTYIPHLCFNPKVTAHGSCRLCIVNVNGRTLSACTTPAEPGLKVDSNTDTLQQQRLRITQMLFTEGNHYCPTCEWSGNCQLQAVAYDLGMTNNHYPMQYPKRTLDTSHPHILLDQDRCIHCGLCERAGRELDNKHLFSLSGRGIHSYLTITSDDGSLKTSTIDAKDNAAHICPVGALLLKDDAYHTPIGQRLYDTDAISVIGNCRPEDQS